MTGTIRHALESVPAPLAYALVFVLVFAEAALFVGFVLPGETAVVLGGVLAGAGRLSLGLLLVVVVVAAIAGDSTGYEVGRRFGPRVMALGPLQRQAAKLESAQDYLRRRGGVAVLLGRFTAFLRAVMPALAGLAGMRYRVFLAWNALGGIVWGVGFTLLGWGAGNALDRVTGVVGKVSVALLVVLVVAALVAHRLRERRDGAGRDLRG